MNLNHCFRPLLLAAAVGLLAPAAAAPRKGKPGTAQPDATQTVIHYLSGTGADQTVEWDFRISDGMRAGEWAKIPVPSNWEVQGFGNYQYGNAVRQSPVNETGEYRYTFDVPAEWQGRAVRIVFEASMTDTFVTINGRKAGSTHQGAFYRFSYDISDLLRYGKSNTLEATVKKESDEPSVNAAERRGDYWNFGGIFRPVFLEVKPALNIARVAIDARHDGQFTADCFLNVGQEGASVGVELLDREGRCVASTTTQMPQGGDRARLQTALAQPACWSAETPNLYTARFTLRDAAGKTLHTMQQRFGFRTVEMRPSDGLYINGVKVNVRGVNRHSFRPESGRTLDRAKNYEDVRVIKSMNMNAVRLSHYPADPEFYEACDELGLYVLDELGGWHGHYSTAAGRPLIESMVCRDQNYPSVILWDNGNEGGWNTELDAVFHEWDLQKRPVIRPQGNFGGFETMHYRSYGETQEYMRKPEIWMPTEFLHGLYDGGHGAGLYDYWEMQLRNPRFAGGFLWDYIDQGVVRTDQGGRIDCQGNWAADGIVGPHLEKEGSYYTVREVWNPVQVTNRTIDRDFDGVFRIRNRYDFTDAAACRFAWEQVKFGADGSTTVLEKGSAQGPAIAPHTEGEFRTGMTIHPEAECLYLTATDPFGEELWRWSWPVRRTEEAKPVSGEQPTYQEDNQTIRVQANGRTYRFDKQSGYLQQVEVDGRTISFGNGPQVIALRRGDRSLDQFYNHDDKEGRKKERIYFPFEERGKLSAIRVEEKEGCVEVCADYVLGNLQQARWTILPDGQARLDYTYGFDGVVDAMGIRFDYPESKVLSKQWLGEGPYRVWQNRMQGTAYGVWENDYNDVIPGESWNYPEFKGFFADVQWMKLRTTEGSIRIGGLAPESFVGVYEPRDGRDRILYTFPEMGISLLKVIPPVRNKVNTTDLNGPSAQPYWAAGTYTGHVTFDFD